MTTPWIRFYVRVCRLLFWTLAYRREAWRENNRWLDKHLDYKPKTGIEHVRITATNGSVVKNVYVNHGRPHYSLGETFYLAHVRQTGRRGRMPRA